MIVGLAVTRKRGFALFCLSVLAYWEREGGSNTLRGRLGGNSNPARSPYNSREHKLDALRTRRQPKAWLHVALSVLVMNASAIVNSMGGLESLRKCVA